MINKLLTALWEYDNIICFNEYSGNSTVCCIEMGNLDTNLTKINPDDTNNDKDDPETIFDVTFLAWRFKFQKRKTLKKDLCEELIRIARYPRRWSNFFMSNDEKNRFNFYWIILLMYQQYTIWKYGTNLIKKIMHEGLIYFKIFLVYYL